MRTIVSSLILAVFVLIGAAAGLCADEEKLPLDKLPKAVQDAVKAKFPGAELVSAAKEKEGGETIFEVALKYKGHKHDVTFKEDGTLVEDEKEIPAEDLPAAVKQTLESKYPKATIKEAEEVTKGDKVVYELHLVTAEKQKVEVVIDPQGKVVKVEKKDKEKD
jgi:uncharacterized membrane protein YkoI